MDLPDRIAAAHAASALATQLDSAVAHFAEAIDAVLFGDFIDAAWHFYFAGMTNMHPDEPDVPVAEMPKAQPELFQESA